MNIYIYTRKHHIKSHFSFTVRTNNNKVVSVFSNIKMNRFFLDTEYTNGNFYIGDIFDLALIAEKSGHIFHTLIKVSAPLDNYIKFMCSITDEKLKKEGVTFKHAFEAMIAFISAEKEKDGEPVAIMAHGGFTCDFPLLVINCLKNKCDISSMLSYRFVDTVKILQHEAELDTTLSLQCSLQTLSKKVFGESIHPSIHSAANDVIMLKNIFQYHPYRKILLKNMNNTFNINTITWHLNAKMTLSIDDIYNRYQNVLSLQHLVLLLSTHLRKKSSLNATTVEKIAVYFYKYCFHINI